MLFIKGFMAKIYFGNLSNAVTDEVLRNLFSENQLGVGDVTVKRGYAFVDCQNPEVAEKAVSLFNGEFTDLYNHYLIFIKF